VCNGADGRGFSTDDARELARDALARAGGRVAPADALLLGVQMRDVDIVRSFASAGLAAYDGVDDTLSCDILNLDCDDLTGADASIFKLCLAADERFFSEATTKAVAGHHVAWARELIAGHDTDNYDVRFAALWLAAALGQLDLVERLLPGTALWVDSYAPFAPCGLPTIMRAAVEGHADVVRYILDHATFDDNHNFFDDFSLYAAVAVGFVRDAERLIIDMGDRGININMPDDSSDDVPKRLLTVASLRGDEHMVAMLLARGADARAEDEFYGQREGDPYHSKGSAAALVAAAAARDVAADPASRARLARVVDMLEAAGALAADVAAARAALSAVLAVG